MPNTGPIPSSNFSFEAWITVAATGSALREGIEVLMEGVWKEYLKSWKLERK
jgi:hypothetical protein